MKKARFHIKSEEGFSLVEVLFAITLFGLSITAFVGGLVYGIEGSAQSGKRARAAHLASEGIEAVRSIRDAAFNEFQYAQSGVDDSGTEWEFLGEATTETIDEFTRTITFSDVCRDGSEQITTCPGAYTDPRTVLVTSQVSWQVRPGFDNSLSETAYFTTWNSQDWTQTDWVGGSGQAEWADITQYDSDDGNVYTDAAGEVSLAATLGAKQIIDDTQAEWDAGTYSDTQFATDHVELDATGLTNTTGTWTSPVHDGGAGADSIWSTLSWLPDSPYGKPLPNNGATESGYDNGNADMANNIALYHLDEALSATSFTDSSGNSLTGSCTAPACPTMQIAGKYSTAASFDGTDDVVTVADNAALDITDAITIEGWINVQGNGGTPSGGGTGEISDTITDSWEHDISNGDFNSMINISGNIYAVAYQGDGGDGFVKTVEIDTSGNITASAIDILEFDTDSAEWIQMIHISGDIYAIVYEGRQSDGFVVTVDIDSSGNIENSVVDSYEFDTSNGEEPSITHVTGDYYLITYNGPGSDGWAVTIDIDSAGDITNSIVDSLEFDTDNALYTQVTQIDTDTFAVVYSGSGNDGFLVTFDVDATGGMGASITDSLEFDTSSAYDPYMFSISGDIYGIAYSGQGNDGYLVTVDIDSSGNIANSVIDSFEFDVTNAREIVVLPLAGDFFAFAYAGDQDDGYLATIEIDTSGNITKSVIDILEFDLENARYPSMVQLTTGEYAIAYSGGNADGFITTASISVGGGGGERGMYKADAYGIDANTSTATGRINGTEITAAISSGWNHIALTYDRTLGSDQIKLYINGQQQATATLTATINTNTNDLLIGDLYQGYLDEFAIYSTDLDAATILDRYERGSLNLRYQVRSCDDAACSGETYIGSDGTAGTYYSEVANTGTSTPSFSLVSVPDNRYFQYQVTFDTTDSTLTPELNSTTIDFTGPTGYEPSGTLTSSAFDMGDASPVQIIQWTEDVSGCTGCDIDVELRTAPDVAGSPGTFTAWYGAGGATTTFDNADGARPSTDLNGNQWVQYRVTLTGDATTTPILQDITVNYQ